MLNTQSSSLWGNSFKFVPCRWDALCNFEYSSSLLVFGSLHDAVFWIFILKVLHKVAYICKMDWKVDEKSNKKNINNMQLWF